MKRGVVVMVGTRKGAYLLRAGPSRARWSVEGPLFAGEPVFHMAFDGRDGASLYAACNGTWGGPKVRVSHDLGKTWTVASNPAFPPGSDKTLKAIWHLEPGHASQPDVVWAGTAPAGLFRSVDDGMTWEPMLGLMEHPTASQWNPNPTGATVLHSIALDPSDADLMHVGISAGGVYESTDGGASWRPWNEGSRAGFMPNKYPEVGQCVHHLVAHPAVGGVRFQQNHTGVYWRDTGDAKWRERSKGLPSDFGFTSAIHPRDPETAYVIPLDDRLRIAKEPGIAVYRTRDRGKTWRRLDRGLPKGARAEVMREGMATDRLDPAGIYFGTVNGEVWASADEGRRFERITAYLPPVLSVSAGTFA